MKIAVVIDSAPDSGGGFLQELTTALLLDKHRSIEYNFVYFCVSDKTIDVLNAHGINSTQLHNYVFDRMVHRLQKFLITVNLFPRLFLPRFKKIEKILSAHEIDLILFLGPSSLSELIDNFNYIVTVWDLCHRDSMEFPEVNFRNQFHFRDSFYKSILPKAVSIIVNSEKGKEAMKRFYGVDDARVAILPFLSGISVGADYQEIHGGNVDIKLKYGIDGEYIYYPAQFWAHKNHVYILEALSLLKSRNIYAVFSGYDKGNLAFVLRKARQLGVMDRIRIIGFIEASEIPFLYKQALALAMPTYFGPTNIPPLEAFALGCPVCYSDLPGLSEQVANAAFLMDLRNPSSLAEIIIQISDNKDCVRDKIFEGYKILNSWTADDYWLRIKSIIDDYSYKLKCWK